MENSSRFFFVLGLLVSTSVSGFEPCPQQVTVTFPDFSVPPLINGSGLAFADPPGYLVDWVKQAIVKTGCPVEPVLNRRPTRRGFFEISQGQTDILIPASPEEISAVVFPTTNGEIDKRLAFAVMETSLWVRRGERLVEWNGNRLTGPPGFTVGVSAGSLGQSMANDRGWKVDVAINSQSSIDKLIAGRVVVALVADVVAQNISENKRSLIEKLRPRVEEKHFYSVPSVIFYAQYPQFVSRYWLALCQVSRAEKKFVEQRDLLACPVTLR
jgi:hypothetical protein